MADEGTYVSQLRVVKGNHSYSRAITDSFDIAGKNFSGGVQNIGTTEELVAISTDVGTLGFGIFRNLDATNYVEIGVVVSATFYPFAKLLPGEPAGPIRLAMANNALYAKANTAAVDLEYQIYEL